MPEALTTALPFIQAGTAGAGLVGNIMNSIQQGNVASQAERNAKLSPQQLATMVSKATQPLDRSLINTVNNQVSADMASRGLAEAPGIFAATEGQALAPFVQSEQDRALQLVLSKLGLPASTLVALRSGGGGFANLSPLLQMLMSRFPTTTPTQQMPEVNPAGTDTVAQILQQINAQNAPSPGLTPPIVGYSSGTSDTGGF